MKDRDPQRVMRVAMEVCGYEPDADIFGGQPGRMSNELMCRRAVSWALRRYCRDMGYATIGEMTSCRHPTALARVQDFERNLEARDMKTRAVAREIAERLEQNDDA
jgi:hypothetical protein